MNAFWYLIGEGDGPVPIVTLLINGGSGSLEAVKETLGKDRPVVVVKGSGRAAYLLEQAITAAQRYVHDQ